MKKAICLLLVFLLALIPILVGATNDDDVEKISIIEYDFITGTEREIDIQVNKNDLTAPSPMLGVNPNMSRMIIDDSYTRAEVNSASYNSFPYSAIGLYSYQKDGSTNNGTGFIVANNLILTSAHCVYTASSNTWSSDGYFLPHAPRGALRAEIVANGERVIGAYISSDYKDNSIAANDWAILVVEDNIGSNNGIITLSDGAVPYSQEIVLIGYDATKTMYESPGHPMSYPTNEVVYNCDTTGTNSGSPVFYQVGSIYYAFAIHHGIGPGVSNVGCRITQSLINRIIELSTTGI